MGFIQNKLIVLQYSSLGILLIYKFGPRSRKERDFNIFPIKQVNGFLNQIQHHNNIEFEMKDHEQGKHLSKTIKSFISGGVAGVVSKTIIAPIERVKYLFIVRKLISRKTSNRVFTYQLFISDFKHIVKTHGVLNLWRGNLLNVARIFPHAAIDFATFDYLRGKFYKKDESNHQKIVLFLCGATAGLSSLTITTPLEFVRVRLAMEKDIFTYKNNTNAFKTIFERQGFLGFYRGYGAAACGIFIYHGCSFFLFTKMKEAVKKKFPNNYSKWYIDFLLGGLSAIGQLVAYPFDVLRKRMQGQKLLLDKKQIQKLSNYIELMSDIMLKQGGIRGFYKGISLNVFKAPLSLAIVWTVKNHLNRILDEAYDF